MPASAATALPPAGVISILIAPPARHLPMCLETGRSGRLRLIDCTRIISPEFPIDKQFMMVLFNVPQSRVCCKWLPHASNSQPDDSITTRRRTT
ncbi:hypothetical protein Vi05172_g402 [Venturia inaequalis]|nr:hypothetical protein Vi05172_g402 [Venturia inaequalis]